MTELLRRPAKGVRCGPLHRLAPEDAGWRYVGFELWRLDAGQEIAAQASAREHCLVLLGGCADVEAGGMRWNAIGERSSPFDGRKRPYSVYVPAGCGYRVRAQSALELAVASAPGGGDFAPRLIPPEEVAFSVRGEGTNRRYIHDILPETAPAHSLLVVEVFTPPGHWSSYPPHKHDRDALPEESLLEETYYHRIHPAHGFAFQRVYSDDRSLDVTMTVEDGDLVLVPRGYHPCAAAHGYELYYLNVMAGPKRIWRFTTDPAHSWLLA